MSEIKHVTKDDFQQVVLEAAGPVLVDFWAAWCGPCRMMAPVLEQLAQEIPDLTVCKVDVDDQPELATQYQIMSIPALKLFRGGKVAAEQIGACPAPVLRSKLGL